MKRKFLVPAVVGCAGILGVGLHTALRTGAPVSGVTADRSVSAILGRSCKDCHSEQTAWPWYSHLPQIGTMIRSDVKKGREMVNFSRWSLYTPAEKGHILDQIAALIRTGRMPPRRYTLIHPRARLSKDDAGRLVDWALARGRNHGSEKDRSLGN